MDTKDTDPKKTKVIRLIRGEHADPDSATSRKIKVRTEEYLRQHPGMKERRDRFISEYIRDWDGPSAVIRAGGAATTAVKMANEYLREPYVSLKIQELMDAMEAENLISDKIILAGLIKEARYQGIGASHGARVSAWNILAKIKGLEKTVVQADVTQTVRGGVMVVPVLPGSNEWEQLASTQQKQLKESASEAVVEIPKKQEK